MKAFFVLIQLFWLQASSQTAIFKEIKLYANPKYFNPEKKYPTIIFPQVLTKNRSVNETINDKIKQELFSIEKKQDLKSELKNQISEGLTDVSYEVTYNKNYFLSLNIYVESSGGNHIAFYTTYFNFDLRDGKEITLSNFMRAEKIDSFKTKVFQARKDSLNEYKREEFKAIDDKIIDSSDYKWIVGLLDDESDMDKGFGEIFSLSDEGIEIIEPISFPSVIRSQQPTFHLRYSFDAIKPIMNSNFLNIPVK